MRLEERKGAVRGARNHGGSVYTPCVYSLARVEEGCALLRVGVFPPGSVQRRAERRTERKRAEAISSVRCRAFHSLSFHDERPWYRFECFARFDEYSEVKRVGKKKRKEERGRKKEEKRRREATAKTDIGGYEPGKIAWHGQRLGYKVVRARERERELSCLFREDIPVVRVIRDTWKVVVRSTVSSRVLLPLLVLIAVVNRIGVVLVSLAASAR